MRLILFVLGAVLAGKVQAQTNSSLTLAPLSLPTLQPSRLSLPSLRLAPAGANTSRVSVSSGCRTTCTLPVKWLKLTGERRNDTLCFLQWETTNEVNNLGFHIERSLGNTNQFQTVGFVAASLKADPVLQYEFPDGNDYSGITYYRLRQVDVNQQFSYSKTIAVKGYAKANGVLVYPNPVQSVLQATVTTSLAGSGDLSILDANGKAVLRQRQAFQKGNNLLRFETGSLASGTYLLQATLPGGKQASAIFIKQ